MDRGTEKKFNHQDDRQSPKHEQQQETLVQRRSSGLPAPIGLTLADRVQMRRDAQTVSRQIALAEIQRRSKDSLEETGSAAYLKQMASKGVEGATTGMPHQQAIQKSFGKHDISGVQSVVGGQAEKANEKMGSEAFATGNTVSFKNGPDLHTAAHEATHVVQQRGGVQLKSGIGQVGDQYEVHADQVADLVVQGKSAEGLLDKYAGGSSSPGLQHKKPKPLGHDDREVSNNEHNRNRKRRKKKVVSFDEPDVVNVEVLRVAANGYAQIQDFSADLGREVFALQVGNFSDAISAFNQRIKDKKDEQAISQKLLQKVFDIVANELKSQFKAHVSKLMFGGKYILDFLEGAYSIHNSGGTGTPNQYIIGLINGLNNLRKQSAPKAGDIRDKLKKHYMSLAGEDKEKTVTGAKAKFLKSLKPALSAMKQHVRANSMQSIQTRFFEQWVNVQQGEKDSALGSEFTGVINVVFEVQGDEGNYSGFTYQSAKVASAQSHQVAKYFNDKGKDLAQLKIRKVIKITNAPRFDGGGTTTLKLIYTKGNQFLCTTGTPPSKFVRFAKDHFGPGQLNKESVSDVLIFGGS